MASGPAGLFAVWENRLFEPQNLSIHKKINLDWYGMTSLVTLRGLPVDWAFLDACLHLWDPQAHVFQFGIHYEEMCSTYEDFTALLGSHCKRALVAASTETGYFRSFLRMLGLSVMGARELVVYNQVDLAGLSE
ncbi:hypothetical protein JCGZ_10608 [Jatropha curcas]|uniref:Aminotransferase-like plant mobile domain-containing protein n=1 Tax=Jatropha curcas TaxID=180498 RepID=A0A067JL60_JATCU|nr:hypothetical protein JCGZ_10608 [Jatropha curcas]